ncbi:MAG: GGDEF domain-containing protein [Anaerolineae bacterium]|nr:GGDEF domain-containing protein [Anaerolineae bacterium]
MNDSLREQFLTKFNQCALITEKVAVVTDSDLATNMIGSDPTLVLELCRQITAEVEEKRFVFFDKNVEGSLHFTIGRCNNILSNLEDALRAYTEALFCFQGTGNLEMEARCMSGIGGVYDKSGDYTTSYDYTYNALEKALKTGNRLLEARLMNDLGYTHVVLGEYEKAMNYLIPCIQYLEKADDTMLLAFAKDSIAQAYFGLGKIDDALTNEIEALELSRKDDHWYGVASFLSYIALIYNARGEVERALACVDDAEKLSQERGFEMEVCTARRFRGQIFAGMNRPQEAIEAFKEAATIAQKVHANRTLYEIYEEISKICRQMGDYRQALEYYERFHNRKEAAQREKENQERRYRQVMDQARMARREADLLQLKNDQLENEINERKLLQQKLETLAKTDSLTNLLNRRAFFTQAALAYERANRSQQAFSVILFDLDHFKEVNDRHGHQAGDQILAKIGQRLARHAREIDLVCRFGGEEFILLLPGMDMNTAHTYAREIKTLINKPIRTQENEYIIYASFGISTFDPAHAVSLDRVIEQADTAMYTAKAEGRNRIVFGGERRSTGELVMKRAGLQSIFTPRGK